MYTLNNITDGVIKFRYLFTNNSGVTEYALELHDTSEEVGVIGVKITDEVYLDYINIHDEYKRNGYATRAIDCLAHTFTYFNVIGFVNNTIEARGFWDIYIHNNKDAEFIDEFDFIIKGVE